MKFFAKISDELKFYNKSERIFYSIIILSIILISFLAHSNKIALLSAVLGTTYTLFAGKGKVYCYYIGLLGTFLYCIISYKNGFLANTLLYGLYFFPMQVLGIFKWKKHLNKEKNEIIKTKLTLKQRMVYFLITIILTSVIYLILKFNHTSSPFLDSIMAGFSVLGQYLTVKRLIEQWHVWFLVNLAGTIMWFTACLKSPNYIPTLLMWFIYLILSIYFYLKWRKELKV